MIEFRCAQCGHTATVKDEHAGKTARCPKCKTPGSIPSVSPSTVSTSPATPPGNHAVANTVKKCPHCGKEVPGAAVKCPHCKESVDERSNAEETKFEYLCSKCGHNGKMLMRRRGSVAIYLILLLSTIWAGLLYESLGMGYRIVCPMCKNSLIKVSRGQKDTM